MKYQFYPYIVHLLPRQRRAFLVIVFAIGNALKRVRLTLCAIVVETELKNDYKGGCATCFDEVSVAQPPLYLYIIYVLLSKRICPSVEEIMSFCRKSEREAGSEGALLTVLDVEFALLWLGDLTTGEVV